MVKSGHRFLEDLVMFATQLKSFFWVARLGSITQAARQLGLSQPTVTTQIRALEAHYGVELFHRQGGRLTVSAAWATPTVRKSSSTSIALMPDVPRSSPRYIPVPLCRHHDL